MYITFYGIKQTGKDVDTVPVGRLILERGKLHPEPADSSFLNEVLGEPLLDPKTRTVVWADEEPERFLHTLKYEYNGIRLSVGPVLDTSALQGSTGVKNLTACPTCQKSVQRTRGGGWRCSSPDCQWSLFQAGDDSYAGLPQRGGRQ